MTINDDVAINDKDENEGININVGEIQSWLQKDFLSFDKGDDDDAWARSGDWRDWLKDRSDDDEIQHYLDQAGDHEDVDDHDAFEALYETHK